ncbi:MAG TPA: Flp family type IVb pilin [Acidisarcina sp.]
MLFSKCSLPAAAEWGLGYMRNRVSFFLRDEAAQDIVEYALIAVLIGLGTVVSTRGLATSIGVAFSRVQTALTSAI